MRVLAINDISCVGKCSLTVALPVLSASGVTCDILPTALLSTHTGGFMGYTFLPLDDEMNKICDHWETLGLKYDLIYSGYLGSRAQIAFVREVKRRFLKEGGVFVVDPVLGDNFTFYKGFDRGFADEMLSLCAEADYILPNETESYLLTGERNFSAALKTLASFCPHPVIWRERQGRILPLLLRRRRKADPAQKDRRQFSRCGRRVRVGVLRLYRKRNRPRRFPARDFRLLLPFHRAFGAGGQRPQIRAQLRKGAPALPGRSFRAAQKIIRRVARFGRKSHSLRKIPPDFSSFSNNEGTKLPHGKFRPDFFLSHGCNFAHILI